MKPLDVTASLDYGYRLVWTERHYLMRLALVPMALKLLTLGVIIALGWHELSLRSTIISIPSLLSTGWMLSHLSRLVFYGQRWPFRPTGDAVKDGVALQNRAYGISAGTLFFTIVLYLFMAPNGIVLAVIPPEVLQQMAKTGQSSIEPGIFANIAAMGFLVLSIWSARFLALFIPAAAGLSVRPIVWSPQAMLLSLQVIGIVLVAFIPVILASSLLFSVASAVFTGGSTASPGMALLATIWLIPTIKLAQLIATASAAFGIKAMIEGRKA